MLGLATHGLVRRRLQACRRSQCSFFVTVWRRRVPDEAAIEIPENAQWFAIDVDERAVEYAGRRKTSHIVQRHRSSMCEGELWPNNAAISESVRCPHHAPDWVQTLFFALTGTVLGQSRLGRCQLAVLHFSPVASTSIRFGGCSSRSILPGTNVPRRLSWPAFPARFPGTPRLGHGRSKAVPGRPGRL